MKMLDRCLTVFVAFLCLAPLLAGASAQAPPPIHVALVGLTTEREVIVNEDSYAIAVVNVSASTTVTVTFTWSDGEGLRDPGTPGGLGHSIVRSVERGEHVFRLRFTAAPTRAGEGTLVATVSSARDDATSDNRRELPVFVQSHHLLLTFDPVARLDVPLNGSTPLRFFVLNDGNANDTPRMSIPRAVTDWQVRLPEEMPELRPGESATGHLIVRPNRSDSLPLEITLKAMSRWSAAVANETEAPRLTVNATRTTPRPQVILTSDAADLHIGSESPGRAALMLRNLGENATVVLVRTEPAQPTWNVTLEKNADWPAKRANFAITGNVSWVALWPGESVNFDTIVKTNGSSHPASRILARLESPDHLKDISSTSFRAVKSGPDLSVTLVASPADHYRNDTPTFAFLVRNLGGTVAPNATLRVSLSDNLDTQAETTVDLGNISPGRSSRFNWSTDLTERKGTHIVHARASSLGADTNATNDATTLTFQVQAPDFGLIAPTSAIPIVPGETLRMASADQGIGLTNRAETTERFSIRLATSEGWMAGEWQVELLPGQTVALTLVAHIPTAPGLTALSGELVAHVISRPTFVERLSIAFRVEDSEAPTFTWESPSSDGHRNTPATIRVALDDAVGIRTVEGTMSGPGGESLSLTFSPVPDAPKSYTAVGTPASAGTYLIVVRAVDAKGNVASTTREWVVRPSLYDGVRSLNFQEGSVLSEGRFLFSIPTGNVIAAVISTGANSVRLNATGEAIFDLADGAHRIEAEITYGDGGVWRRQWNVSVDETPPRLGRPSVRADADGWRIEVEAADALKVAARIHDASGTRDVELTRDGVSFGARIDGAWTRIEFIAQDEAGNTAATNFDALDDDVPGPAAALAMVALLVAVTMRRRRARR